MAKEVVESLVDGGKATAGPPLGPALGPMGVNISMIVKAINEKTKEFDGMKVPVKIEIDPATKAFEIFVGTPPTSALIKQELKIEKGSGEAATVNVADLSLELAAKIARMKSDDLLGADLTQKAKEVMGVCLTMGVTVDGKDPREAQRMLASGELKLPE